MTTPNEIKPATPAEGLDGGRCAVDAGFGSPGIEETWRADAAERRAAEAEATVRRIRELLEEVIDGSVDASTYPDGPCLDRELRKRIKAELLPNDKISHAPSGAEGNR
jgi:hypothetical protein